MHHQDQGIFTNNIMGSDIIMNQNMSQKTNKNQLSLELKQCHNNPLLHSDENNNPHNQSPKKESDFNKCMAKTLLDKIQSYQDYSLWRKEKTAFLKRLKVSFEELSNRVDEQIENIIHQQESDINFFEKHKETMSQIIDFRNKTLEQDQLNFFKNQCISGKLEKELHILEQSKSLKQNILGDFYTDIINTFANLKNTDLVLLEKLKKPDQIIRHEIRKDSSLLKDLSMLPQFQSSQFKLKPLEIPFTKQNDLILANQNQNCSGEQKLLQPTDSMKNNLILGNVSRDSPVASPLNCKSPSIRSRYRNLTASPSSSTFSPNNMHHLGRSGYQQFNSPLLSSSHSSQYNQHCFQGKKIYNFEFSLEETQSVLLKDENELILIGEQIKIWDNQQRKITYEKRIEQIHEFNGKKYSIGWGQFSVLDSKHVVIGNNNTKQIFLFQINPFILINVLEEDHSCDFMSPLYSPLLSQSSSNQSTQATDSILSVSRLSSNHLIQNSQAFNFDSFNINNNNQYNQYGINNNNDQEELSRIYGHFVKVDENTMACSCSNNRIQVWNLKKNQLICCIKASSWKNKINRLIKINQFTIASHCENENRVKLWNCITGKQQRKSILLPTKMIQNMWTFRSCLYIVSFKNTIYVYNINSLKLLKFLQLPFQIVLSKQLSENYLLGVQNYNEVFILSLKDFSLKKVIKMEFQITDIIIFNSRVFATFNICSESRKGKIEYLQ